VIFFPGGFWIFKLTTLPEMWLTSGLADFLTVASASLGMQEPGFSLVQSERPTRSVTTLKTKEILYIAVMAMRRSPQQRVSLQDFADRYLSGQARDIFLNAAPNADGLSSAFDFQRELFDATLQFRIFQLKTGVFVSSPLTEIGESVQITEGQERRLSCEGEIVGERLRTRHA
jgi:hypothetical protein